MTWEYRVLCRSVPTGADDYTEQFEIVEVYYEEGEEKPTSWCPTTPLGDEALDNLRTDLLTMLEALNKPVINESEFPK
jgi:hypothetical protein